MVVDIVQGLGFLRDDFDFYLISVTLKLSYYYLMLSNFYNFQVQECIFGA